MSISQVSLHLQFHLHLQNTVEMMRPDGWKIVYFSFAMSTKNSSTHRRWRTPSPSTESSPSQSLQTTSLGRGGNAGNRWKRKQGGMNEWSQTPTRVNAWSYMVLTGNNIEHVKTVNKHLACSHRNTYRCLDGLVSSLFGLP